MVGPSDQTLADRPGLLPTGQPPARLLFIHAHPDDESLATGVAIAHHLARGDEVHVLTATLGEEGEVIPAELAHLEGSDGLGPYRRAELAAAMAALGVTSHTVLGEAPGIPDPSAVRWRDSGMAGSAAAAHPRAWAGASLEEAAPALRAEIGRIAPDIVITYDPQGGYSHPDHIATHRVTMAALASMPEERRPEVFVVVVPRTWAREDRTWLAEHASSDPRAAQLHVLGIEDDYPAGVVDDALVSHVVIDPVAGARVLAALEAHATQVTVYPDRYALSNDIAARLPHREGYARWSPAAGTVEDAPPAARDEE